MWVNIPPRQSWFWWSTDIIELSFTYRLRLKGVGVWGHLPSEPSMFKHNFRHSNVTRLGYFWKILVTNFLTKIAPKLGSFFHNILINTTFFQDKDWCGYFWEQLGYFLINHLVSLGISQSVSSSVVYFVVVYFVVVYFVVVSIVFRKNKTQKIFVNASYLLQTINLKQEKNHYFDLHQKHLCLNGTWLR